MGTNLALSSGSEDSGSSPGHRQRGQGKTRSKVCKRDRGPWVSSTKAIRPGSTLSPVSSSVSRRTQAAMLSPGRGVPPGSTQSSRPSRTRPDQEDFRAAEHNRRAAYVGACGLVHEYPFSCLAAESCRAAGGAGGSGR